MSSILRKSNVLMIPGGNRQGGQSNSIAEAIGTLDHIIGNKNVNIASELLMEN